MEKIMYKTWVKAQMTKQSVKDGIKKFLAPEDGGADGIIIAVVIIIIVVALGIAFREQIGSWIGKLFKSASDEISDAGAADFKDKVTS